MRSTISHRATRGLLRDGDVLVALLTFSYEDLDSLISYTTSLMTKGNDCDDVREVGVLKRMTETFLMQYSRVSCWKFCKNSEHLAQLGEHLRGNLTEAFELAAEHGNHKADWTKLAASLAELKTEELKELECKTQGILHLLKCAYNHMCFYSSEVTCNLTSYVSDDQETLISQLIHYFSRNREILLRQKEVQTLYDECEAPPTLAWYTPTAYVIAGIGLAASAYSLGTYLHRLYRNRFYSSFQEQVSPNDE